jgi:hypothetical protein
MIDSDDLYGPMKVDGDLSTTPGTETLADRDMVSLGFDTRRVPQQIPYL